jgi:hypothetical protein
MVVHICNPCTQEDCEFKSSLDYLARSCLIGGEGGIKENDGVGELNYDIL